MNHSDDVRHLAECQSCRERFTKNVLPFDAARRRAGALEFAAAAVRIERERESAANIVDRELRQIPIEKWPGLAESPALRNNAALEQMSEEVRKRIERKPLEALAIANVAAAIAESLPANAYPPAVMSQIRSTALRDRANALRYLGRLDEAFDSIETAEARLGEFAGAAHDRAIVWFVKSMILGQMDHFEEAERVVTAASVVFADVNDLTRFFQAGLIYGNLLVRQKRYEDAQRVFLDLLTVAKSTSDTETEARLYNNIGHCALNLEDYGRANIHFSESIARFTDLGLHAEVPRTNLGAALVLIGKGQVDSGLARLEEARHAFIALGMMGEAGLCALRIIEVLIDRGDTAKARALTGAVIAEFEAAGIDTRAVQAVASLQSSIDADGATGKAVRTVHEFVQGLTADQARAS